MIFERFGNENWKKYRSISSFVITRIFETCVPGLTVSRQFRKRKTSGVSSIATAITKMVD